MSSAFILDYSLTRSLLIGFIGRGGGSDVDIQQSFKLTNIIYILIGIQQELPSLLYEATYHFKLEGTW